MEDLEKHRDQIVRLERSGAKLLAIHVMIFADDISSAVGLCGIFEVPCAASASIAAWPNWTVGFAGRRFSERPLGPGVFDDESGRTRARVARFGIELAQALGVPFLDDHRLNWWACVGAPAAPAEEDAVIRPSLGDRFPKDL